MTKRALYRVKFKELNHGQRGGLGDVQSFRTHAKNCEDACRKLRKRAKIISVRRIS